MVISDRFSAYVVSKDSAGRVSAAMAELPAADLPPGDVVLRVAWSSLNYKDALAATGHPGVARRFPHVPGIDAAGTVERSDSPHFAAGDAALVTGYGLGAERWGGYAELVRVPAEFLVPLPKGLSLRESMILGTAGLTAALSVEALLRHGVQPGRGEIVVTGASGGVGSLAVALAAKAGYTVVASTGKPAAGDFLGRLGASRIVDREEVDDRTAKPLLSARWAGGIDTVGGNTLATLLRSTERAGCIAASGLVGGSEVPLTVYPFILRGVTLAGIDSDQCPLETRIELWNRLAGIWRLALDALAREVPLADIGGSVQQILAGGMTGRVVVRVT